MQRNRESTKDEEKGSAQRALEQRRIVCGVGAEDYDRGLPVGASVGVWKDERKDLNRQRGLGEGTTVTQGRGSRDSLVRGWLCGFGDRLASAVLFLLLERNTHLLPRFCPSSLPLSSGPIAVPIMHVCKQHLSTHTHGSPRGVTCPSSSTVGEVEVLCGNSEGKATSSPGLTS